MLLRCAFQASAMAAAIGGLAFTAGVGFGVAAVGAACLLRRGMRSRAAWQEDRLAGGAGTPEEPILTGQEPSSPAMPG
ncbi:hypothetical protein [Crenalkalicoccus roseus]|uniref:hypothetical protein n=1 Tax=Crenalkalicoccus roseus TaxID=1485588 RepID=UPI0010816414|nr:hypothetical protein [Crenalkalicoccus roseus]